MNVSVVVTVKNEAANLAALLDSLRDQTRPPDEVVVCDAGSTDGTLDILYAYRAHLPLRVLVVPGCNISQGRNQAIHAAAGPFIAVTDAGVTLGPYWLEELTRPLAVEGVAVVSGWFESDPHSDFEVVLGATVLPSPNDVRPRHFLPSSRSVAFRKAAWEAVGGYPEWLDYGEDLVFDLALRERYGPFPFARRAVAYFRPRPDLGAFARQYYLYARGDGKANLWPRRHAIRYATYLLGLPLILRQLWRGRPSGPLLLVTALLAYCRRPAQRLWPQTRGWPPPARLRALALIPIIRFVGDVAKMIGYPAGVLWRRRARDG